MILVPEELPRRRMVEEQLEARGIRDPRVLEAMARVPRHLFVPEEERDRAYEDRPLPIGYDQTISQPWIVARMTEVLALGGGERVLEIGTGSGYQTAILLEMGARVFTVELVPELAARARATLRAAGYEAPALRVGDGSAGWPGEAPFDRALVAAGAPSLPVSLVAQLNPGGSMVIPVGDEKVQDLLLVRRGEQGVTRERICECIFVKLYGAEGW